MIGIFHKFDLTFTTKNPTLGCVKFQGEILPIFRWHSAVLSQSVMKFHLYRLCTCSKTSGKPNFSQKGIQYGTSKLTSALSHLSTVQRGTAFTWKTRCLPFIAEQVRKCDAPPPNKVRRRRPARRARRPPLTTLVIPRRPKRAANEPQSDHFGGPTNMGASTACRSGHFAPTFFLRWITDFH